MGGDGTPNRGGELAPAPRVRRLDVVAIAEPTESPQGDAQGNTGIGIVVIHPSGAFDLILRNSVHG